MEIDDQLDRALSRNPEYAQIQSSVNGSIGWLGTDPETGVQRIYLRTGKGAKAITPQHQGIGSRVYEYGGRSWCFGDGHLYYVDSKTQQIYCCDLSGNRITAVTDSPQSRFLEPTWSAQEQWLYAIEERPQTHETQHRIVRIDPQRGSLTEVHTGYDFYASLALSPNGQALAWISWNHPDLPWTSTYLLTLRLAEDQSTKPPAAVLIAGSADAPEALAMPRYDASGQLWVISDRSGYWNLYRVDPTTHQLVLDQGRPFDQCSAPWQAGLNQYQITVEGTPVCLAFQPEGIDLLIDNELAELAEIGHIRELALVQDEICFIGAGNHRALNVFHIPLTQRCSSRPVQPQAIHDCTPTSRSRLTEVETIRFESSGTEVHGYLYPALSKEPYPPLLLSLHGGPTSSCYPILNPLFQFWQAQGFAVFDLNYRGSSNQGRAYRNLLHEQWGVVEVEDIHRAVEHLIALRKVDPDRLFIRGRSSGGFSALLALCGDTPFRAATSYFGVTDPRSLAESTHKFESRYLDWLIGDPNTHPDRYRERSPLHRADEIDVPVLFLQGCRDRVVTPDQSTRMYDSLVERGVNAEIHYFPDEGHGFRHRDSMKRALKLELEFYRSNF